jgi:hypothetical protein
MAWTRDKPACSTIRRQGPPGFVYRPEVIDPDEEPALAEALARLNLRPFEMQGYVARRRVAYFGRRYEGSSNGLEEGPPIPDFLQPLRRKAAAFAGLTPDDLVHALVNEYPPGAPIAGLVAQVGGGGGGLLDHGGVLLGHLVHLVDRGVDLVEAGGLFLRGLGDLGDQGVDLATLPTMPLQRRAGVADQPDAARDLGGAAGDQGLDLLGRLGRALGQGPDFLGHDREAATGVAGPRRFDAGVQGQQVGLEGDLVDHADDLGDLARALLDLAHGGDRLAHDLAGAGGVGAGAGGGGRGLLGALGAAAHRGGDLVQRGGGFLQAGGLLLGARDRSSEAEAISSEPARMPPGRVGDLALMASRRLSTAALKSSLIAGSGLRTRSIRAVRSPRPGASG